MINFIGKNEAFGEKKFIRRWIMSFYPPQKIVLGSKANVVFYNLEKWEIENSCNFKHISKQEQ